MMPECTVQSEWYWSNLTDTEKSSETEKKDRAVTEHEIHLCVGIKNLA